MAMGVLPGCWRLFALWYRHASADIETLSGIAIMALMKRLRSPPRRSAKQATGRSGQQWESYGPRGADSRGADVVDCKVGHDLQVRFPFYYLVLPRLKFILRPSSTCAIIYTTSHACKMQAYLDEHLGSEGRTVATADQVKQLPYLDACPLGVDVVMWTVGGRTLVLAANVDYASAQVDVDTPQTPGFLMPAQPSRSSRKFSAPNRHLGAYRRKLPASRYHIVTSARLVEGGARSCDSNPCHVSTTSTYSCVLLLISLSGSTVAFIPENTKLCPFPR
jgi:hypothetical protein